MNPVIPMWETRTEIAKTELLCELRVASCELRVASCELRVASCELRVASCVWHCRPPFGPWLWKFMILFPFLPAEPREVKPLTTQSNPRLLFYYYSGSQQVSGYARRLIHLAQSAGTRSQYGEDSVIPRRAWVSNNGSHPPRPLPESPGHGSGRSRNGHRRGPGRRPGSRIRSGCSPPPA